MTPKNTTVTTSTRRPTDVEMEAAQIVIKALGITTETPPERPLTEDDFAFRYFVQVRSHCECCGAIRHYDRPAHTTFAHVAQGLNITSTIVESVPWCLECHERLPKHDPETLAARLLDLTKRVALLAQA